jgi:hypothetical protein
VFFEESSVQAVEGPLQRTGTGHFFEHAEEQFSFGSIEWDVRDWAGTETRYEAVSKVACGSLLHAALADDSEEWAYILRADEKDAGAERDRQARHLLAFREPLARFLQLVGALSAGEPLWE